MEMILNERINEAMHFEKLSNGMNCYIIPKEGFAEKFAIISMNYGSVDNHFMSCGRLYDMPCGIAHFLEHKIFEDEEISVIDEFGKLGANINAYTAFSNTAYYFSCHDNFDKCLRLLLECVQSPYFTDHNIEKEKGIINQEISMFLDDPYWAVYLNMLDSMFYEYPVKESIAGTAESISRINKDMLYTCYNTFYRPENMVLICTGDINAASVFEAAERYTAPRTAVDITRLYGQEPDNALKQYVEAKMPLGRKLFNIGFKDVNYKAGTDITKKIISTKLILDYTLGDSTEFFTKLFARTQLDDPFALEFVSGNFFGTAMISSSGDDPHMLSEMVFNELTGINENNFDINRFKRIIKKSMGRYMRGFNSLSNIAIAQADMCAKGLSIFDVADGYRDIKPEDFFLRLRELFRDNNRVLSVINTTL